MTESHHPKRHGMMLVACLGLLLLVSPTHGQHDNHIQSAKAIEEQQASSGLTSMFSGILNSFMGYASGDVRTKSNMSDEEAVGDETKPHFSAAPKGEHKDPELKVDTSTNRNLAHETEEHAVITEPEFAQAQGRAGTNQPCRCEYPGEGVYGPPPLPPAKTKSKSKKKGKGKAGKKKKKGSKSKSKGIIIPGFQYVVIDGKTVIPRWDPYCQEVIFVCPDDRPPVNGVEWTCPGIPPPRPPGISKSKGKSKKKGKGKKKKGSKSKSKGIIGTPGIPGVGPPVIRPNPVYCFLPPDWPGCVRPPTPPPPTPEAPTPEPPLECEDVEPVPDGNGGFTCGDAECPLSGEACVSEDGEACSCEQLCELDDTAGGCSGFCPGSGSACAEDAGGCVCLPLCELDDTAGGCSGFCPESGSACAEDAGECVCLPPQRTGSVAGIVFLDVNGNGVRDDGEPGVEDVRVRITDSNQNPRTVTTNGNGEYSTRGVPIGPTQIKIIVSSLPSGAVQTAGTDPTRVVVTAGSTATDIDGYQLPSPPTPEISTGPPSVPTRLSPTLKPPTPESPTPRVRTGC